MNKYRVLARKYRPQIFRDVVAQATVIATLKNAISQKRVAHAYLFCGCRGTGKTTLARLFAKAINCDALSGDIEPCNVCSSCCEITAGQAIDVLEIDGASHRGIEDIRQINETIGFAPVRGHNKIYLIDEVHMLTKEAFNALLKTLEEPPSHVKFLFCTTEPHKIPATILSRCQRFNLRRIPVEKITDKLTRIIEDISTSVDKEALETIAEMSEGSLRDALSILDQILVFEKDHISLKIVAEVFGLPSKEIFFSLACAGEKNDFTAAFKVADHIFSSGKNISYFLEGLISHFRTLLLMKNGIFPPNHEQKQYEEIVACYRQDQLIQILEILTEGQQSIKFAVSERTSLEMLLLKILRTHQQISLESLVQRLISLEKNLSISEDPTPRLEELPKLQPISDKISFNSQKTHFPQKVDISAQVKPSPVEKSVSIIAPTDPPKNFNNSEIVAARQSQSLTAQEQSRFDTILRFAAKELNGALKKEN